MKPYAAIEFIPRYYRNDVDDKNEHVSVHDDNDGDSENVNMYLKLQITNTSPAPLLSENLVSLKLMCPCQ